MLVNGTTYKDTTPQRVIELLEWSRATKTRIRVHYGDVDTGRDWMDRYDVTGHIGRSMGPTMIPLMIANARSMGGGGVLDHCIVKITTARGKRVLYEHPKYHTASV